MDVAGLVPVYGEAFDLLNAGIYALRGDKLNAGLSLAATIPFIGWLSTGTKVGIKGVKAAAKGSTKAAVHGNSLKSLKPTWGYKLYSQDGTFLKNGITSKLVPESRYTKSFMLDKFMDASSFPNRKAAWDWEFQQNQILRGPLNKNMH